MSIRFAFTCGALAVVILGVAAGDQWPKHPVPDLLTAGLGPTPAPRPAVEPPGPASAEPDCNPQNFRASLRPQGPMPAPGQMPAGSTMARIAERGHLIAGIDQDTHQFAFRNTTLWQEGFDIDIVRDIVEAIFGDRERVVFRPLDVTDRVRTVKSGHVDLLVATSTITCRRREQVEFSTVYYEAGQRVLVNRGSAVTGLDDPRIGRVCAARGSTSLGKILAAPSKPVAVGVAATTDCLMLLQLAEIDAISTDDALLASMAAQDPRTEIIGPRITEEPYGIAISKDTPDLVRFVNAVLERRVQDGRWQTSYERWLMPLLGPAPSPPTPQYRD
ncbi:MAG: glutamate ABC transporter substrate-binding protein [Pseudonocardiaceae bacterium]